MPAALFLVCDYGFVVMDYPGEPVLEETLQGFMVQGKITDTPKIWLDAAPSGLLLPNLHHPPVLYQMPFRSQPSPIYPGLGQAPSMLG